MASRSPSNPEKSSPAEKPTTDAGRGKALASALAQIEKQFGKGSIMRLNERVNEKIDVVSTGSLGLDIALGVGGLPKGRVVEIYGPESSGKCLVKDTRVWSDRGLETLEEVFQRAGMVASCTARVTDVSHLNIRLVNERGELEQVAALTHNNRRPTLRLRLASGRVNTVTYNHPLRVLGTDGFIVWRKAGDMRVGDVLVSGAFGAHEDVNSALTADEAIVLGYLIAEGTMGETKAVAFSNWDPEVVAEYTRLAEAMLAPVSEKRVVSYDDNKEHRIHSKAARTHLAQAYDIDYTKSAGKRVPRVVRHAKASVQAAFLSALFEGDGWIEKGGAIGYASASEALVRDVQLLLMGLGIPSFIGTSFNKEYERDYWRLLISCGHTPMFMERIRFRSGRRQEEWERHAIEAREGCAEPFAQKDGIPHLANLMRTLRADGLGSREWDDLIGDLLRKDMDLACSRRRLAGIVTYAQERRSKLGASGQAVLSYLETLVGHAYTFEQLVAIEDGGEQPTFDVVMPGTHSFLANGVLSHNTTLTLQAIAQCQRQGGVAAFVDAEHALDPTYAEKLGVNVGDLLVSQPDTGEQALEIVDMLVRSGAVDMVVVDSVAALTPKAEIEGEMGDSHVGLHARLMSQALRKLTGNIKRTNCLVVFINQIRMKIGVMFGSPETTTGGNALKFYASVRLDIRRIGAVKKGEEVIGSATRVKVVKNKVAPPFRQCEFEILYGEGTSREGEIIEMGSLHNIIDKSGAWYSYNGERIGQGKENVRQFLKDNPAIANEIDAKIREKLAVSPLAITAAEIGESEG